MRYPTLIFLLLVTTQARAQQRGDLVLQAGFIHVQTPEASKPLHTELRPSLIGAVLGIDDNFDSPGTSVSVSNGNTIALTAAYFLTDHWAIKVDGGVPITFDLKARGVVAPTGLTGLLFNVDLGDPRSNPIASAKEWTPAILLQYRFGPPRWRLRPYASIGFSYTWFTEVAINPSFQNQLNTRLGAVLALAAGKSGPTSVHTDATQSFDPVFNLGLSYALSRHIGISFSQSFIPISTVANIDIQAQDGTTLSHSTTRIQTNTFASSLLLDYRF